MCTKADQVSHGMKELFKLIECYTALETPREAEWGTRGKTVEFPFKLTGKSEQGEQGAEEHKSHLFFSV